VALINSPGSADRSSAPTGVREASIVEGMDAALEPTSLVDEPTSRRQTVVGLPRAPTHFAMVDGLRGLAAAFVVVYHSLLFAALAGRSYVQLFSLCRVAVPIFFAIGGFVLYRPFFRERWEPGARHDLKRYAKRRLWRIFPGYWFALTVGGALTAWGVIVVVPGVFSKHWWILYGLGQIYSTATQHQGLGVAWTLCNEVIFYVLLPLLSLWIGRIARRWWPDEIWRADVVVLGALWILANVCHTLILVTDRTLQYTFPTVFDYFVPGMLLGVVSVVLGDRPVDEYPPALRWLGAHASFCWVAALIVVVPDTLIFNGLAVARNPFWGSTLVLTGDHLLQGAIAMLIAMPAMLPGDRRALPRRALGSRLLVWLGLISYGIYLWHMPLLDWIANSGLTKIGLPSTLTLMVCTLVSATAVGAASWYLLELPVLRRFTAAGARRAS
jgi:peptidoglycan/LPS O-acetylase OafA/YrhL